MGTSQTSLLDALAVPELVRRCSASVAPSTRHDRGSPGLKVLRNVCKPLSVSMLDYVQGYNLQLGISSLHITQVAALLKHTRLSRLNVKIIAEEGVRTPKGCNILLSYTLDDDR